MGVPKLQLFCLPYSGASAMVYARWRRKLPQWVTIEPLELPGRGTRIGEPSCIDAFALAAELAQTVVEKACGPYALFGHSLGAILAFELAHALRDPGMPDPLALFASGTSAPTRRQAIQQRYREPKSDAELMQELRSLGGTPEAVLANDELMSLMLPVLRADFLLCGCYQHRPRAALRFPLRVFGGRADKLGAEDLIAWQEQAGKDFSLDMFAGGHFFIHEQEDEVLRVIEAHLRRDMRLDAAQFATSPADTTGRLAVGA